MFEYCNTILYYNNHHMKGMSTIITQQYNLCVSVKKSRSDKSIVIL